VDLVEMGAAEEMAVPEVVEQAGQVSVSSSIAAQAAQASYPSPASSPPTSLHSDDTSPASSVACLTPPSGEDQAAIASADGKVGKVAGPLDGSFAFAGPAVW